MKPIDNGTCRNGTLIDEALFEYCAIGEGCKLNRFTGITLRVIILIDSESILPLCY